MVVRLSRLDRMLELAGEVIIVSSNLNALSHQIQEGSEVGHELAEDVKDLSITSSRISSDLHNLVTDVRTVDMADLFGRFRRLARDTSRRLGKAIHFSVEGEDVFIDKKVSEKIYDPIAHQIRNSMAHGIEDEATRKAAGKDPVGHVRVSVRNLENHTSIEVVDDGAGIDPEKIRRKVVELGYSDAESAASMSTDKLYEYLFLPGFSTADETSTTSGRGVGMDVVHSVMQEINGETRIESEVGRGTTFTFLVPLVTAVNISDAFLVQAGKVCFAFPIQCVLASQSIPVQDVHTTNEKGRSIQYLGHILPLFDLMRVFAEPPIEPQDGMYRVLVLEHRRQQAAFVVSDFLSPQKIVISEFDSGMQVEGLSGTATLSGRRLGMVVDVPVFFNLVLGQDALQQGVASLADSAGKASDTPPPDRSFRAPEAEADGGNGKSVSTELAMPEMPDSQFIQELSEMVKQLNSDLLDLDEKREREQADGIFRLAHSIKGDLTMFGAEKPASTTHRVESILERVRRNDLEICEEVMDALFDGVAYLEEVVAAMESGSALPGPSEKLLNEIKAFEVDTSEAKQRVATLDLDTAQVELDPTGEFYLSSRRRDGAALYQCRIEFDPGDQPRFLVAYLILSRIQRVADVLGCLPKMADMEVGICEGGMVVLFSPRDTREDLLKKLEANLREFYGVSRFDITPFA